jgi:hypothetical protein
LGGIWSNRSKLRRIAIHFKRFVLTFGSLALNLNGSLCLTWTVCSQQVIVRSVPFIILRFESLVEKKAGVVLGDCKLWDEMPLIYCGLLTLSVSSWTLAILQRRYKGPKYLLAT